MKRFRVLIALFCLALSIPLAFFVWRTYHGLEQEEAATLQFFATTLFDEMEAALTTLVRQEEGRAIDAYAPGNQAPVMGQQSGRRQSASSDRLPTEDFILGYFQNNPDGSFQSPAVEADADRKSDERMLVSELRRANRVFNSKRVVVSDRIAAPAPVEDKEIQAPPKKSLADRYLDTSRRQRPKSALGQQSARYENVEPRQAKAIAMSEKKGGQTATVTGVASAPAFRESSVEESTASASAPIKIKSLKPSALAKQKEAAGEARKDERTAAPVFQAEVAPLQAVFINDQQIYIFRRIMFSGQIYRQGFVLKVRPFLNHLVRSHFMSQPMARFTRLRLAVAELGQETDVVIAGANAPNPSFELDRTFPSPFGFLSAQLVCEQPPPSAGRRILNVMVAVLTGVFVLGFAAIYKSVLTVVEHSERRSQFVSAVTHELKTPLTNIRMYIEMLEQGMAGSSEKESEYYGIVNSEGARLSRLINNVLELSKLERRQRLLEPQRGDLSEVIESVDAAMHVKLALEGFDLKLEVSPLPEFEYDREAMIQILINLIENSIKFGKSEPLKRITIRAWSAPNAVMITVSDTGPGIPRKSLKKIFDQFYRADNSLTRTTRGTGIGLALVKRLVLLMDGSVRAENNDGPGCTITIALPSD